MNSAAGDINEWQNFDISSALPVRMYPALSAQVIFLQFLRKKQYSGLPEEKQWFRSTLLERR